ncbi:MAG: molybdenum cofactor guanylyltransferase [Nitrospirae bacterium]|nr:molybdenum cofactor guanylyltransferase [Nitrospirota bacterium]MBI3594390.1 molybdenum cofactor guanylyltransferase [Nitrospirota bacterium]
MEWTALVLAGGESLRMKEEKAFLQFEGKCLLERTLDLLKPLFHEIRIIARRPEKFQGFSVPLFVDLFPDGGPMAGIYTGLMKSRGPVFAVAVDMPYLNPDLIRFLCEKSRGFDAALFRSPDGLHPLHAVYHQTVLPEMENAIMKREYKMVNLFKKIKTLEIKTEEVRSLDPLMRGLTNINTPEDFKNLLNDK